MIVNFKPTQGESVSLMGEKTKLFFDMYNECRKYPKEMSADAPWSLISLDKDVSFPKPVTFSWICDIPRDQLDIVLHIAETKDFSSEITVTAGVATSCEKYNLKTGTRYYWYAENRGEQNEKSAVTSFVTADEFPRMIYLDKMGTNVRDAGGLVNMDGKRIRQGLLYRGGSIDKARTLTDEGFRTLTQELGVKLDIDLRGTDYVDRPLPVRDERAMSMDYIFVYAGGYDGAIDNKEQCAECRRVFEKLCDRSNYPAYVHCHSGMDRTGTILFLLGLILRIDMETLMLDYELSALSCDGWEGRSREWLSEKTVDSLRRIAPECGDIYRLCEIYFEKCLGLPDAPKKIRKIFLED